MNQSMETIIEKYCNVCQENLAKLNNQCANNIYKASNIIINTIKRKNKLMIMGNGGSASDSQHLSAELIGRFIKDRKPFPAIALTTDTSILTSVSNDYSFEDVFLRQLQGIGNSGDAILAITTSGNSKNIIKAAEYANNNKLKVISLTGNNGGIISSMSDCNISVPSEVTSHIQEMHIVVIHLLCTLIENKLIS